MFRAHSLLISWDFHTQTPSRVVIRSNTKHPVVVMQKENTLLMSGNWLETIKASGIQITTGYNCGLHNSVSESTRQLTLKQPLYWEALVSLVCFHCRKHLECKIVACVLQVVFSSLWLCQCESQPLAADLYYVFGTHAAGAGKDASDGR